jgi:hypothetical protein
MDFIQGLNYIVYETTKINRLIEGPSYSLLYESQHCASWRLRGS